jgi:hypothetical protein
LFIVLKVSALKYNWLETRKLNYALNIDNLFVNAENKFKNHN